VCPTAIQSHVTRGRLPRRRNATCRRRRAGNRRRYQRGRAACLTGWRAAREPVEELFPGRGMHACRPSQYSIKIEQHRVIIPRESVMTTCIEAPAWRARFQCLRTAGVRYAQPAILRLPLVSRSSVADPCPQHASADAGSCHRTARWIGNSRRASDSAFVRYKPALSREI